MRTFCKAQGPIQFYLAFWNRAQIAADKQPMLGLKPLRRASGRSLSLVDSAQSLTRWTLLVGTLTRCRGILHFAQKPLWILQWSSCGLQWISHRNGKCTPKTLVVTLLEVWGLKRKLERSWSCLWLPFEAALQAFDAYRQSFRIGKAIGTSHPCKDQFFRP